MALPRLALIGLAAFTLSACDAIRLPGGETETPTVTEGQAPDVVDTSPEADPVTPTEVGTDGTTTPGNDPVPSPTDTAEIPPSSSAPTLVTSLDQINASLCGLPVRPADPSPTLAEMANAQPADEDRVGTATINGQTAALAAFPGLVKMEPKEILPSGAVASGHCGATRIAPNWFITAAHCLDDDYDEVLLIAGAETLTSPLAKRVNAVSSVCHAAYGGAGNNYVNDIALIRVEDAALPSLSAIPITRYGLTRTSLVPINYAEARMAGWGLTAFNGNLSNTLLSADLTVKSVGPAAITVESKAGSGPCVGDSGGALFVDDTDGTPTLVGVLSVVEQNLETRQFCTGRYAARYTNVQGYDAWITSVISACDGASGLCGY